MKLERIQRRATRWILQVKQGELSYKERLFKLDLLPLTYDREVKDLVYLYKALYGYVDMDITFVKRVNHGRTRRSQTHLVTPFCKTTSYQSSFFNRTVKLWNRICTLVSPSSFENIRSFKLSIDKVYKEQLDSVFDPERTCSWSLIRGCGCHWQH